MKKETGCYDNGFCTIVFIIYEILLYFLTFCYDIMKLESFWWCYFYNTAAFSNQLLS